MYPDHFLPYSHLATLNRIANQEGSTVTAPLLLEYKEKVTFDH